MKNIPQRTLQYNIGLVKYENPNQRGTFDLTTVHSLLIDHHPKFIQLKQLIVDYNDRETNKIVHKSNLNRAFTQKLYKLLCEVTRVCHTENQLEFLNRIYNWVFQQGEDRWDDLDAHDPGPSKERPHTAKTRPYTANTRGTRPDSAVASKPSATKRTVQSEAISSSVMNSYPQVDFKQLKHGEKDFFLGHRTLHPEEDKPRNKLKNYHRKVFYEEDYGDEQPNYEEFDKEKQEEEQPQPKLKFPELPIEVEQPVEQKKQGGQQAEKEGADNVEGGENLEGEAAGEAAGDAAIGEDVNIDDLVGEDDVGIEQEQVEQVDKLRPAIKNYQKAEVKKMSRANELKFNEGMNRDLKLRNNIVAQVQEDIKMEQMMRQWGAAKNKIANEHRRRAESARIVTKPVGKSFDRKKEQINFQDGIEVIDVSRPANAVITKTDIRPSTAFNAESRRVKDETIRDAMITGHLNTHIKNNFMEGESKPVLVDCMTTYAPKPKKKTFQEIIKQAERRTQQQATEQILELKEKLTMHKVTLGANRIAKSLTYHEHEIYEGEPLQGISGKSMLNNPFFKVAKKKKKKKKK